MTYTDAVVRAYEIEEGGFGITVEYYDNKQFVASEEKDQTYATRDEAEKAAQEYVETMQDTEDGKDWSLSYIASTIS